MPLCDAHCHLYDERVGEALPRVMERARAAGVERLVCCGSCEADWPAVETIAREWPGVCPAYGLHPLYIAERSSEWLDKLRERLQSGVASVGETGLDHGMDPATYPAQEEVFLSQLRLARELDRPLTVHCRQAWGRMLELLEREKPPARLLFHSFSGSAETVAALLRYPAWFSFSGAITRPKARKAELALRAVPADRLLIETDAPYILPAGIPSEELLEANQPFNEPAFLPRILRSMAEIRSASEEELAAQVWDNSCRVFRF